jgi:hypothetical protein
MGERGWKRDEEDKCDEGELTTESGLYEAPSIHSIFQKSPRI